MHIDVSDDTQTISSENIDLLHRLLQFTAKQEGVPSHAEMSLNFVDNEQITNINSNYRKKNEPTDVISFALQETSPEEIKIKDHAHMPYMLGDIIISVERATEQAATFNHSIERELGFLTVHGFLHLLGYDHIEKSDEEVMFKRQEAILKEFGLER